MNAFLHWTTLPMWPCAALHGACLQIDLGDLLGAQTDPLKLNCTNAHALCNSTVHQFS